MRENKDNPIMLDDIPDAWRDRCSSDGHERYKDENGDRRYKDNNEIVAESPYRPCAKCGHYPSKYGDDYCIQNLGVVTNACCGHGSEEGYIQFDNGVTIRGRFRVEKSRKIKMKPIREITADINIDRLAEICEAEREGRLVVLPCKGGDAVYVRGEPFPCEIEQITITEDYINFEWASFDRSYECTECWDEGVFKLSDIGKTVFLTREEAEKALAEMEDIK